MTSLWCVAAQFTKTAARAKSTPKIRRRLNKSDGAILANESFGSGSFVTSPASQSRELQPSTEAAANDDSGNLLGDLANSSMASVNSDEVRGAVVLQDVLRVVRALRAFMWFVPARCHSCSCRFTTARDFAP